MKCFNSLEQCSPYSSDNAFSEYIFWLIMLVTVANQICFLVCLIIFHTIGNQRIDLFFPISIRGFALMISLCVWIQMICVFQCRSSEIIRDYRLISIFIVQMIGFFQCQLLVGQLGAMFPFEVKTHVSNSMYPNKFLNQ